MCFITKAGRARLQRIWFPSENRGFSRLPLSLGPRESYAYDGCVPERSQRTRGDLNASDSVFSVSNVFNARRGSRGVAYLVRTSVAVDPRPSRQQGRGLLLVELQHVQGDQHLPVRAAIRADQGAGMRFSLGQAVRAPNLVELCNSPSIDRETPGRIYARGPAQPGSTAVASLMVCEYRGVTNRKSTALSMAQCGYSAIGY